MVSPHCLQSGRGRVAACVAGLRHVCRSSACECEAMRTEVFNRMLFLTIVRRTTLSLQTRALCTDCSAGPGNSLLPAVGKSAWNERAWLFHDCFGLIDSRSAGSKE